VEELETRLQEELSERDVTLADTRLEITSLRAKVRFFFSLLI
jgi:hypothetical protein